VSSVAEVPCEDEKFANPSGRGYPTTELPVLVIEPRAGWQFVDLGEIWRSRELLFFLSWRDIKVRYKQTILGVAWAVVQPLATMVVFSLFFSRAANLAPDGWPYPLFVFAGVLPWFFFANAITSAAQSVVGSQSLVTKIYFPRLLIPMSATGATIVDLAIGCVLLLLMMPFYGILPGWSLLLAPLLALGLTVAALGVGILLAALTVAYRDFRYVVPFMVQLWMFATPSVYMDPATAVGPRGQALLPLNPAYGLIANFRAAVLGGPFDWYSLAVSTAVSLALLIAGCFYFRRVERGFADII
jgi:lipopolysaccharide transport system permease protein